MDLKTVLKGGILGLTFMLLLPCRNLFAYALGRAETVYINLHRVPTKMLIMIGIDILAMLVFSLALTGAVLAGGIWSWKRLTLMRLRR